MGQMVVTFLRATWLLNHHLLQNVSTVVVCSILDAGLVGLPSGPVFATPL